MIYGCLEKEKEADFVVTKYVKDVFNEADIFLMPQTGAVHSIGKKEQGKSMTLNVRIRIAIDLDFVLGCPRNHKDSDKFKNVYLGPNRTKENQLAHNKLVKEMKQMLERDQSKHYFICQRKICSVDKDLSSQTPAGSK